MSKSYENYKDQNDVWLFINEMSDDEPIQLKKPISNIKINVNQPETLDSIITRALNRIDPQIKYIIKNKIKWPKKLDPKTNRNLTFERDIIFAGSTRELSNKELNEFYKRVWPVWITKSANIEEQQRPPSQFVKQEEVTLETKIYSKSLERMN